MLPQLSTYLDFLIALVFNLAVGSIILSLMFEFYAYLIKKRAKFLYKQIEEVLNDKLNLNFAARFYENPQIDLTKRTYRHLPAYISSVNFAHTLINILIAHHDAEHERFVQEAGKPVRLVSKAQPGPLTERFAAAVEALNQSDLKILLKGFITTANQDSEKLTNNIAHWFDEYMNRAAGWYKMNAQRVMFFFAIGICLAFNVDLFRISNTLLHDKVLTARIADMAETFADENKQGIKALAIDSTLTEDERANKQKEYLDKYLTMIDEMYVNNAPIGWQVEDIPTADKATYWLTKVLGCLLAAAALAFGAPFWFDLLTKLVNLRKAGLKPKALSETI